jgi:DnaJ-class molecular chaperone
MHLNRNQAFELLDLDPYQHHSTDDIKKAFKKKALECHPDKCNGSNENFIKIKLAYEILITTTDKDNYEIIFDKLFKALSKLMFEVLRSNHTNTNTNTNTNTVFKENDDDIFYDAESEVISYDISLKISISIDELYREDGKKLKIKYKNSNGEMNIHVVYLSFKNYSLQTILPGKGDWNSIQNEYGDLIVNMHVIDDDDYLINSYIDKHDLIKTVKISLSDYYYGINSSIDHFGEKVHVEFKPDINDDKLPYVIYGKGLQGVSKRGDLYIIFQVDFTRYVEDTLRTIDLNIIFPSLLKLNE